MPHEYQGSSGDVTWRGVRVPVEVVDSLRSGPLKERLLDLAARDELIDELQAISTTDMGSELITELIASTPTPLGWEVGEALAESILQEHHKVIWPWNTARDRRTPKASLPGADLIGFVKEDDDRIALLFGEVKTSSDPNTPPGVLHGRSGMIGQLEKLATRRDIQWSLLHWLRARCQDPLLRPLFVAAAQRFVASGGSDFRLIGCLMRDTEPNELDLINRATTLVSSVESPMSAELVAWYFPDSVSVWPTWMEVADGA